MSWASERLVYMNRTMSLSQISASSSIPKSTISYVMRGERNLPNKYHNPLRSAYQRTAYHDLRNVGLSVTQSDRFKWYSPSKVVDILDEVINVVSKLVNARLDQYTEYLQSIGDYQGEQSTIELLTQAIQESLRTSDLPEERLAVMEYRNTSEL